MGGAGDTTAWHARSFRKLKEFFETGDPARTIADQYRKDHLNAAFASNMDELILEHQPRLWIHGHTHETYDYRIGKTRIICNPRGYVSMEENKGFKPDFTVEM